MALLLILAGASSAVACRGSRGNLADLGPAPAAPQDANPFPVIDGGGAGYALSFDGTQSYATAADANFPSANATQTVEMWIRYPPVPATATQALFAARQDVVNGLVVGFHGGQLAAWRVYVDRVLVQAPALPAANTWHHVAFTFDAKTTTEVLYVDGTAVDTEMNATDQRTPTSVWLGTLDGTRELFSGLMDEVRVWNVARTAAQVAADRAHTPPGPAAGLIAYWTFDDADSGGRAMDASGNGNTVTLGDGVAARMPSRVSSDAPVSGP